MTRVLRRARRYISFSLCLVLLLGLEAPPSSGNETTTWTIQRDKANTLVSQAQYEQSLDQFAEACLKLKEQRVELSIPAILLYRDYAQALALAGMNDEAETLSKALATNNSLIGSYANEINSEGVALLNASSFIKAIDKLTLCLRVDPSNSAAKKNLVTAYNNAALQYGVRKPLDAIPLFRRGLLIDTESKIMRNNLNALLQALGKNPLDAYQRATMGDGLLRAGDNAGAYAEYAEALRLKEDPAVRAKQNAVPKSDPIFMFQPGKAKTTETVTVKPLPKSSLSKPNAGHNAVRLTLDNGIAVLRSYLERKENQTTANELLKAAAQNKDKAIGLISQVSYISPNMPVKELFDEAVKALGKNPTSQNDLLDLAINEQKSSNFQGAVFILNQAPEQGNDSESLKRVRRSAYAMLIAQQISSRKKQPAQSSPYKLLARKSSIRTALQMNFAAKEPVQPADLPLMPDAVDLTKFMVPESSAQVTETSPSSPQGVSKADQSKQISSLGGLDDCVPQGVNADTELISLSNLIDKDSDNDALRVRETILLTQYGNSMMKSGNVQKAANKYREALYIMPANAEAQKKLSNCLTTLGIDPKKASERFKLFESLYDSGLKEASLAELREYSELSQDGPALALLGACLLDDTTESTEGYLSLLSSLNGKWETGSDSAKAMVHLMVSELLQRDAERAQTALDKNRRLKDLQKISSHLKQAALLDRNNLQARDRLLELAKEAIRMSNNATNNLFLAGAYLLQGNSAGANGCYAAAASLAPKDRAILEAYDKFKSLESKR